MVEYLEYKIEKVEKNETVFTHSASRSKHYLSDSGLTAGRVGRARFFSSCFLGTFSGRWRGDPSDLEEAFEQKKDVPSYWLQL